MLYRTSVFNANGVELDQTPRSVASYLDLQCLPISGSLGIN